MNKLQQEAVALAERLKPLYDEVADEILAGASPSKALKNAGYYDQVEQEILNSATVAVEFSTRGTAFQVAREAWRDWYLNTNHQGGALSTNIRTTEASNAIQGVLRKGLAVENSVNQLADTIARSANTATDVKLPKVLRQLIADSRTGTPKEIQQQIRKAEKYVKSLQGVARGSKQMQTAYKELVDSAKKGAIKDSIVNEAINKKLRVVNERIARTEMANAYELGRRRAYFEDPNITGFQWELSPSHPIFDECDYLAEADLYGMGAGVYPLDSGVTAPAHPNCLCTTYPVRDEGKGRYSEERSKEYIKSLNEKDRKRLLGKDTTLANSQKSLENKGITPKQPVRAMMPKELLQEKGR